MAAAVASPPSSSSDSSSRASATPSPGSNKQSKKTQIPVVKKPEMGEYQTRIDACQTELYELQKRLDELSSRIADLNKNSVEFQTRRDEIRKNIEAAQSQIDKLETERNRLVSQIEDAARAGRDMKMKINGLKKNLGFQSSEEIDVKIHQIERHMMAKRLTVPEENKCIAEIKSLERSKPLVAKYACMETESNSYSQGAVLQLRIDFEDIKNQLKLSQQKKKELNDSLTVLVQQRQKVVGPARDLSDEKDQIRKALSIKRAEMNQIRNEMRDKKKEYEVYIATITRLERETKAEERRKKEIERQRERIQSQLEILDDDDSFDVWTPELQLTNQAAVYMRQLVQKLSEQQQNQKDDEDDVDSNQVESVPEEEGMIAIMPKRERDEYSVRKTKKKTAAAAAERKQKRQTAAIINQPLVHDVRTLADFNRLGIEAPIYLHECPAILARLEEKLDVLKKENTKDKQSNQKKKANLLADLRALENLASTVAVSKSIDDGVKSTINTIEN